jgi:rRNA maturation endonuclease Nob1
MPTETEVTFNAFPNGQSER